MRRKPVQQFWLGNGKRELNQVRNSASFSKCHAAFHPKERDGTSPREFLSPATCRVTSGDARFLRRRTARIIRSRLAVLDHFEAPRVCHDTVAELLLHTPTCAWRMLLQASRTSQPKTLAIISKFELVMSPPGFSCVTRRVASSAGDFSHHTIRASIFDAGIQMPTAPSPDASRVPLYHWSPVTSSWTLVGSSAAS